ncbi:preprotein translocase subunit SecE [Pendulispora brunnea]|uniref:Protein translocase subunit SecE n=1 Tax=Pendulispora brunnea TaxID=2905690 RepID=A0ABZ2K0Y8_9BACT
MLRKLASSATRAMARSPQGASSCLPNLPRPTGRWLFETTMSITQKYKEKEGDSPEEGQESSESEGASTFPSSNEGGAEGAESGLARPIGIGVRKAADEPANGKADALAAAGEADEDEEEDEGDEAVAPAQFGTTRFVFAAYFGGAILIAFIVSKVLTVGWLRLSQYKPQIGEPHDELVMPLAGAVGLATAIYYWKRTRARELAEEVADELSKVTWPSKQEVTNSTAVVLVTTALATIFFALMDRFWGFVTNLVYGS